MRSQLNGPKALALAAFRARVSTVSLTTRYVVPVDAPHLEGNARLKTAVRITTGRAHGLDTTVRWR